MAKSANHSMRELTDPAIRPKDGIVKSRIEKPLEETLVGGSKVLKPEFIKVMLNTFFSTVPSEMGKQASVFQSAGATNAIITCMNEEDARDTLNQLNLKLIVYMNDYIEEKLGESCSNYFRTMTLFESKIEQNRLIAIWT